MKGNITLFFLQDFLSSMLDFLVGRLYNIIKEYPTSGGMPAESQLIYAPPGAANPGRKEE